MARHFAKMPTKLPSMEAWQELDPMLQWAYTTVRIQPDMSQAGIIPLRIPRWANASQRVTVQDFTDYLNQLAGAGWLVIDWEHYELLIRDYVLSDGVYKEPNSFTGAATAIYACLSPAIKAILYNELRYIDWAPTATSIKIQMVRAELIGHLEGFANPSLSHRGAFAEGSTGHPVAPLMGLPDPPPPPPEPPAAPPVAPPAQTQRKTGKRKPSGGAGDGSCLTSSTGGTTGGDGRQQTSNENLPSGAARAASGPEPNGGAIVKAWIDHLMARGGERPPEQHVGQASQQIGKLLGEGIPGSIVLTGVLAWADYGRAAPSVIPSFVNQVLNPPAENGGGPSAKQRHAPGSGAFLRGNTGARKEARL
jgi:hypothetical protein